jgi:hypothetical protein
MAAVCSIRVSRNPATAFTRRHFCRLTPGLLGKELSSTRWKSGAQGNYRNLGASSDMPNSGGFPSWWTGSCQKLHPRHCPCPCFSPHRAIPATRWGFERCTADCRNSCDGRWRTCYVSVRWLVPRAESPLHGWRSYTVLVPGSAGTAVQCPLDVFVASCLA